MQTETVECRDGVTCWVFNPIKNFGKIYFFDNTLWKEKGKKKQDKNGHLFWLKLRLCHYTPESKVYTFIDLNSVLALCFISWTSATLLIKIMHRYHSALSLKYSCQLTNFSYCDKHEFTVAWQFRILFRIYSNETLVSAAS